ncbi:MAG TPA: histidine phosphatase family protein [Anaerolineales bacterium]|nr:histidine phosphatase family protein [Anaerolineales bacterium]
MSKTLLLLRHAKSSWNHPSLNDFERPLNERGERSAPRVGRLLTELGIVPERALVSAAVRARQTAEKVLAACDFHGRVWGTGRLYLADPQTYLEVLALNAAEENCVLLVGHNNGIEQLASQLSGKEILMPTACLVQFDVSVAHWAEIHGVRKWALKGVWRVKELDN